MMLAFVLIAGSLAAGAAVLLLLPLHAPARGRAAGGGDRRRRRARRAVVRRRRPVCGLQQLRLGRDCPARRHAGGHGRATRASGWPTEPDDLEGWLLLGRSYSALEQFPLAVRAFQRADRLANGQNAEAIMGMAESLLAQDFEQTARRRGPAVRARAGARPDNPKALFYSAFAALSAWRTAAGARTLPAACWR